MESAPYFKNQLYSRIYTYSKKYRPYNSLRKIGITLTPQKFSRYILIIGMNMFFGILAYVLVYFFTWYLDKTPLYLLFFIVAVSSAIFGGMKSAFLTIGIISLEVYLFMRLSTGLNITLYTQLIFFIISSVVVSILINSRKENKEVKKLKEHEKNYARAFIQLHGEHVIALNNIRSRDQFLSIISHELKTPLTVMLLKIHSMKDNMQHVSVAHFSIQELMKVLENSEKQIKWLTVMINDLLDVSLITTGRMHLEREDTDLLSLTKQVKQSFSELIKAGKYKIEIHANHAVVGKWDKSRIEQAITNLVSNAIKYGEGKPISITIFKSGGKGKFIIKDQGMGIPQQEQKIIFDLFKRASGADKYKKGLGVGLFITAQIINMHGGKINVSSAPAHGTMFTIELPFNTKLTS